MKKKYYAVALILCLSLLLTACSSKPNIITGYSKGDVTLGDYKGLTYSPLSTEVTDEDVDKQIDSFMSSKAETTDITEGTVENGDTVAIDFVGYMNGEAFEGGTGSTNLTIGSGSFIPGFEDGLIGVEVGSKVSLDLTFPDPYPNNPDYAGKPATFEVTVNSISISTIPELNDEFIAANTDYTTVAAYREYVRQNLITEAQENADSQRQYDLVSKVIANSTFNKDLTEEITTSTNSLIANYDSMFQSYYGIDAATFYAYFYGYDTDTFNAYMRNQAETNIKYGYVASAIVEAENLKATDEEIEELANSMLESYGYETVDALYEALKTNFGEEGKKVIAEQVKLNKAADIIYDTSVAE